MSSDIGGVLTSGIQDISALLPLLGTGQCEDHLGAGLVKGFLYPAAAPLSIFGSLGIAKGGFKVLVASITSSYLGLSGARKLKDCGFGGSKDAIASISLDDTGRYQAETELLSMMESRNLNNPDRLTVRSSKTVAWNMRMICYAAVFSLISTAPYVYLNLHGNVQQKTVTKLIFPIARALGSFLVVVFSQLMLQHRILTIIRNRLIYMTIDHQLEVNPRDFERLKIWGSERPSDECLWCLNKSLDSVNQPKSSHKHSKLSRLSFVVKGTRAWAINTARRLFLPGNPGQEEDCEAGKNAQVGSDPHLSTREEDGARVEHHPSMQQPELSPDPVPPPSLPNQDQSEEDDITVPQRISKSLIALNDKHHSDGHIPFVFLYQVAIALGICLSVAGYIGCFSLVQASTRHLAPLVWLGIESSLSIIRMMLWGSNPDWDDETGVNFSLQLSEQPPLPTCNLPAEDLDNDKLIPLTLEREFLREITSFVGPLLIPRPVNNKVTLFYTLTRESTTNTTPRLYLTILDIEGRNSFIYTTSPYRFSQSALHPFILCNATLTLAQLRYAAIEEMTSPEANHITQDEDFMTGLATYYNSILTLLKNRPRKKSVAISQKWLINSISAPGEEPRAEPAERKDSVSEINAAALKRDDKYLENGQLQRKKSQFFVERGKWTEEYLHLSGLICQELMGETPEMEAEKKQWMLLVDLEEMEQLLLTESVAWEQKLYECDREVLAAVQELISERDDRLAVQQRFNDDWRKNSWRRLTEEEKSARLRLRSWRDAAKLTKHGAANVNFDNIYQDVCSNIAESWKKKIKEVTGWLAQAPDCAGSYLRRDLTLALAYRSLRDRERPEWARSMWDNLEARHKDEWDNLKARVEAGFGSWEDNSGKEWLATIALSKHAKYLFFRDVDMSSRDVDRILRAMRKNKDIICIGFNWADPSNGRSDRLQTAISGIKSLTSLQLYVRDDWHPSSTDSLRKLLEENPGVLAISILQGSISFMSLDPAIQSILDTRINDLRLEHNQAIILFSNVRHNDSEVVAQLVMDARKAKCEARFLGPIEGSVVLKLRHKGQSSRCAIEIELNGTPITQCPKVPVWEFASQEIEIPSFRRNESNLLILSASGSDYILADMELLFPGGKKVTSMVTTAVASRMDESSGSADNS